eukprot:1195271-Prorocentrum_minimum.AAC.6
MTPHIRRAPRRSRSTTTHTSCCCKSARTSGGSRGAACAPAKEVRDTIINITAFLCNGSHPRANDDKGARAITGRSYISCPAGGLTTCPTPGVTTRLVTFCYWIEHPAESPGRIACAELEGLQRKLVNKLAPAAGPPVSWEVRTHTPHTHVDAPADTPIYLFICSCAVGYLAALNIGALIAHRRCWCGCSRSTSENGVRSQALQFDFTFGFALACPAAQCGASCPVDHPCWGPLLYPCPCRLASVRACGGGRTLRATATRTSRLTSPSRRSAPRSMSCRCRSDAP